MNGTLVRREDLDTDTRRGQNMRIQGEDGHLQAKGRGLEQKKPILLTPCRYVDLRIASNQQQSTRATRMVRLHLTPRTTETLPLALTEQAATMGTAHGEGHVAGNVDRLWELEACSITTRN